jgi:HTH-type transcriptional regulator/antitoxin HipB
MTDFTLREMGEALRTRRKKLGLTQQALAELAGVGVVLVIELEKGKSTVRLDRLMALLSALGLQLRLEFGGGGMVIGGDA